MNIPMAAAIIAQKAFMTVSCATMGDTKSNPCNTFSAPSSSEDVIFVTSASLAISSSSLVRTKKLFSPRFCTVASS